MFGKRTSFGGNTPGASTPRPPAAPVVPAARTELTRSPEPARRGDEVVDVRSPEAAARDKEYFQTKSAIFNALIDSIDLS